METAARTGETTGETGAMTAGTGVDDRGLFPLSHTPRLPPDRALSGALERVDVSA